MPFLLPECGRAWPGMAGIWETLLIQEKRDLCPKQQPMQIEWENRRKTLVFFVTIWRCTLEPLQVVYPIFSFFASDARRPGDKTLIVVMFMVMCDDR